MALNPVLLPDCFLILIENLMNPKLKMGLVHKAQKEL